MKKLKRLAAVLTSAVLTLGASGMNVNAVDKFPPYDELPPFSEQFTEYARKDDVNYLYYWLYAMFASRISLNNGSIIKDGSAINDIYIENGKVVIHYYYKGVNIVNSVNQAIWMYDIDENKIELVADDHCTDPQYIKNQLEEYIMLNGIHADVMWDRDSEDCFIVNYLYTHPEVPEQIENFKKEYDVVTDKMILNCAGSEKAPGEKVTDPYEMLAMLREGGVRIRAALLDPELDGMEGISMWRANSAGVSEERAREFAEENNFDMSKVVFGTDENGADRYKIITRQYTDACNYRFSTEEYQSIKDPVEKLRDEIKFLEGLREKGIVRSFRFIKYRFGMEVDLPGGMTGLSFGEIYLNDMKSPDYRPKPTAPPEYITTAPPSQENTTTTTTAKATPVGDLHYGTLKNGINWMYDSNRPYLLVETTKDSDYLDVDELREAVIGLDIEYVFLIGYIKVQTFDKVLKDVEAEQFLTSLLAKEQQSSGTSKINISINSNEPIYSSLNYGDVNLDGSVGIADAIAVGKNIANPTLFPLKGRSALQANVVNDNEINSLDSSRLIEYLLNKISYKELAKI